jgi:hypothetical protein
MMLFPLYGLLTVTLSGECFAMVLHLRTCQWWLCLLLMDVLLCLCTAQGIVVCLQSCHLHLLLVQWCGAHGAMFSGCCLDTV